MSGGVSVNRLLTPGLMLGVWSIIKWNSLWRVFVVLVSDMSGVRYMLCPSAVFVGSCEKGWVETIGLRRY